MRADYLYGFDTAEMIGSKKKRGKQRDEEGGAVCGEKSKRREITEPESQGKKIALTRGGERGV